MSRGEADEHFQLVDERAFTAVEAALGALLGCRYVLVGGWAVYAYGSPVPSVDTDLFVRRADRDVVVSRLSAAGLAVGSGQQCELLDLDGRNILLGQDLEMGDPDIGYVPARLFEGRLRERELPLPGGPQRAIVPDAPALLFTKMKAYHDRALSWEALRDPAVMALIPASEKPQVRSKQEAYYRRKAGKDLFDVAYLATHEDAWDEAWSLLQEHGLDAPLRRRFAAVPPGLESFAVALAGEDRLVRGWIETRSRAGRRGAS